MVIKSVDVIEINSKSNIAIATLWTPKEFIFSKLPKEVRNKINLIGTLYTDYGINLLLKTLAERNNIDTIIVFGKDLSKSGEKLVRLFKNKDYNSINLLIDKGIVEKVVNSVRLIDLRESFEKNDFNVLIDSIEKYYKYESKPVREKYKVEIKENIYHNYYPLPLSSHLIYETSLFSAWIKSIYLILRYGFLKPSQIKTSQKEYLNLLINLGLYGKKYELENKFFDYIDKDKFYLHIEETLSSNDKKLIFNYFSRIFNHKIFGNQLEKFIDKILNFPQTRRALINLWDLIDFKSEKLPSAVIIMGNISGIYYNHTVFFRSIDFINYFPINAYAQIKLAEYIVEEINKKSGYNYRVGNISIFVFSAHIYEEDLNKAETILNENISEIYRFVEDPKGNYIIYIDNNQLVVEHRSIDNNYLIDKVKSEKFKEVYNKLRNDLDYTLFSHSFYIGKELFNAYIHLKQKKKYNQDKV